MHLATTTAGRVEGRVENGLHVFRGIPFAEPPVGPLRFKPPQPRRPWTGMRDATRFGPWAHQDPARARVQWWAAQTPRRARTACRSTCGRRRLDGWQAPGDGLDPRRRLHRRCSSWPIYDGARLARRGDVVVVTVNYRLGALGFLELDELGGEGVRALGNAGLLDQIAALEWVRDNVAAFGGDPANVTIFGESAGAISVSVLLALPRGARLFHKEIAQSGAASIVRRLDRSRERASEYMQLAGATSSPTSSACPLPTW